MRKIIGINNEDVFRNINVIYQRSIESRIDKEIQHILTGAVGTNYKNILEKWSEEYFSITRESAWEEIRDRRNDRQIEILTKELDELTEKREKTTESNIKSSHLEKNIKKLENELNSLEQDVKSNKNELNISKQYIDLLKEKDNDEEKVLFFSQEIEKYNKLKTELDAKEKLLDENYSDFKDVSDDEINSIKEYRTLKQDLEKRSKNLDLFQKQKNFTPIKKIILSINGIVIAALVYVAKLIYQKPFLLYVSIGLGLISVVYLIISIIGKLKTSFQYQTRVSTKKDSVEELKKRVSQIKDKSYHLADLEAKENLFSQYNEYKKIMREVDNLNYALEQLSAAEEIDLNYDTNQLPDPEKYSIKKNEIEKNLISINANLTALEKENPGLSTIKENRRSAVQHIQKLKEKTDKKEKWIEELKKQIYNLNKELTSTAPQTESIASLNYKIDEVQREIDRCSINKEAYKLAISVLNDSIIEYQKEHLNRLSKNISNFFKDITKEKHGKVILTEDFEPVVLDEDKNPLKNLSCGTEDQLYFAVRLALLKEINDLTSLPLLLDDPFVNFDRSRLEVVKEILYNISKINQVILFTHIKSYSKWDNIHLINI